MKEIAPRQRTVVVKISDVQSRVPELVCVNWIAAEDGDAEALRRLTVFAVGAHRRHAVAGTDNECVRWRRCP